MNVQSIELQNFNTYLGENWVPVTGVTLLTGDNGAGKSTMLEAVCWALYGETLRGESPVPPGTNNTTVKLNYSHKGHGWSVTRTRTKQAVTLKLTCDGADLQGQTTTETQAKIEALMGPWSRFTATRIFAKEFLAKFGASTDKERKELLEGFLGLERFGEAAEVVKGRLRTVSDRQMQLGGQEQALVRRIASLKAQPPLVDTRPLTTIRSELQGANEGTVAAQGRLVQMKELIRGAGNDRDTAMRALVKAQANVTAANAAIERMDNRVLALQAKAECPTCLQAITDHAKGHIAEVLGAERARLGETFTEALAVVQVAEGALAEAEDERKQLDAQWDAGGKAQVAARERVHVLTTELTQAELVNQMRLARDKDTAELATEAKVVADELDKARARVATLSAVATAYGLKGARHMLLGRALAQIEQATNRVLAQLGLDLKVSIGATATLKSGKAIDAIAFQIIGAGGGAYKAASSGERSRVDVALLLALAQLLGPDAQGFIAFDEVFDALDRDGIARVAGYLDTLGQGRQVLVVTHNPDVQTLFPRATVLRAVKDDVAGSKLVAQ